MDLAFNNLQSLICHKTQTNKQTNKKQTSKVKSCLLKLLTHYRTYSE